jgi:adenine deaminase
MKILIREGSAAKNFEALCSLLQSHPDDVMLCSDDKHPDSLLLGHINHLVVRAVTKGYDVFNVLKAACINPVQHYSLPCGILREGDSADFIMVNNLSDFDVIQTYVRGLCVADSGHSLISGIPTESINFFHSSIKKESDFEVDVKEDKNWVIACMDGQLLTHKLILPKSEVSASNDVVRLAVVNRYHDSPVATAFIKGTGIKKGAIASSVAHDSHNIVVAGVDAKSMARAVNSVMNNKGGLSAICDDEELVMPLPVAGLMSNEDAWQVAESYTRIHQFAIDKTGTTLSAPFMTLSFMALLVIPHLKLSDKGLFDGDSFRLL